MEALLVGSVAFGLSQLLLSLLLLLRVSNWGQGERLYFLLLLAILAYLLSPLQIPGVLGVLIHTLQAGAPGMFWLFSGSVFDDHFKLRPWQIALVAITVVLPLAGRLLAVLDSGGLHWLFYTLPQTLEFVLLALTLWVVSQHWRSDLVESRRRLRVWFFGLNGSYAFALIFSREILFSDQAWLSTWEYLPMGVLLLGINATLLRFRRSVLFSPGAETPVSNQSSFRSSEDSKLVQPLKTYMETESAWREMGLTIGQLASRLDVPQYRLRAAINSSLGYRNFSDFLNSYRIAEASARLLDPEEESLPILTIAMDAGFRSLSSFNKTFRDIHNTTPTQYRKKGNKS
jgi:AraC-like DNA-binding protein